VTPSVQQFATLKDPCLAVPLTCQTRLYFSFKQVKTRVLF